MKENKNIEMNSVEKIETVDIESMVEVFRLLKKWRDDAVLMGKNLHAAHLSKQTGNAFDSGLVN